MFEGDFTHEGDLCTFEVLLRRFGLKDRALARIGEVVHDIDLKDGQFGRPETAGVDHLVAGIAMRHQDDEARLARRGRRLRRPLRVLPEEEGVSATRILTRRDVEDLLGWDECIAAVEDAFRLHAAGRSLAPGVLGVPRARAAASTSRPPGWSWAASTSRSRPTPTSRRTPRRHGLPAIQGVIAALRCAATGARWP